MFPLISLNILTTISVVFLFFETGSLYIPLTVLEFPK